MDVDILHWILKAHNITHDALHVWYFLERIVYDKSEI